MRPAFITDLEDGLGDAQAGFAAAPPAEAAGVAIVLRDATHGRLIESAAAQIELMPALFDKMPGVETLASFEMIVTEEARADEVRRLFAGREEDGGVVNPAVVAVRQTREGTAPDEGGTNDGNDGVLILPMTPAAVAAQLSLIVYARRAFARRYQTTLEELHLNRRIFRSVTSGISVANATLPDLPLVYVNPAFEVMTGYCLEEVQGRNCRFLQGLETEQESVAEIRAAIREQREIMTVIRNFHKDGTPFWNELSLSPIRNRDGELTHFVGIQTDVTARMEFEAALRESEKLAAVGRLASSIAHEINNPLESVMNLLYLAMQAMQDGTRQGDGVGGDAAQPSDAPLFHSDAQRVLQMDEVMRYVALADRELRRVALITSQSLRFYKQSTKPQAIGAGELLHSVLDMYDSRAENSGVVMERRERATTEVVCLESEIRQVLNNLVRNALDAMHGAAHQEDGRGRLQVRTRNATDWKSGTPGAKGVVVTIADNGTGMSASVMTQIYRPFFTTKGIGGTGLGLWISSEIVARHGGRLRVRSRVRTAAQGAGGTVFTMYLPAAGPAVSAETEAGPGPARGSS